MVTRENCIKIGEITKTHHLKGAVIVSTDSDLLEQYADKPVFLLLEGAPVPFFIAEDGLSIRNHTSYIVKFDYVDTIAQAERLVGCEIWLEKSLLQENEAEDYRDIFDLIGFRVHDERSGNNGQVTDVADYSGNIILTLSIFGKEVLLPLSETYIRNLDWAHETIHVHIPEELENLN